MYLLALLQLSVFMQTPLSDKKKPDLQERKSTISKYLIKAPAYEHKKRVKSISERKDIDLRFFSPSNQRHPSLYKNAKLTMQKLDKATDAMEDQGPISVIGIAAGNLF